VTLTCSHCGVTLSQPLGEIPVLGEDQEQKRTRSVESAAQHMALRHPEIMQQVVALSAQMGFAVLMANVKTDDRFLIDRRKQSCALISRMTSPGAPANWKKRRP